jgi:hypothetical protein
MFDLFDEVSRISGTVTLAAEQSGGSGMLSPTRSGDSVGARLHL